MTRKHYRFAVWFSIALAMASSCKRSAEEKDIGEFAIYLVADTTLTVGEAEKMNLNALMLEENPFLTANDITEYSWSEHVVAVTPEVTSRLVEMGMKYVRARDPEAPPLRSGDLLFVVTVGKERIYLGAFWPTVKSVLPGIRHVFIPVLPHRKSFRIDLLGIPDLEDKRSDERIHRSLDSAGLLSD